MKPSEQIHQPSSEESQHSASEDATRLLAEFVAGGRSEAVFQRIVDRLGALVYSSALRRTGDAGLAEEVSQNVFTALAHKATALQRHRTLLAWVFTATRYEACKALRAERSRQKKHAAAAAAAESEQANNMSLPSDEESWREAVPLLDATLDELGPKDRQLVLERFYEGKKFAEIATENGTTEAASKMRVKRALHKLSKLLSARGVSLSAAGIATALGSELAKAAPANAMAGIASNALAASSAAGGGTLTIHTIEIMSTAKTVTATGAAVIALAATPLIIQHSKANRLESELSSIEARRVAVEGTVATAQPAASDPPPSSAVGGRTVHDLLARSENKDIDVTELIDQMVDSMTSQDIIGMIEVFLPLSDLSPDKYEDLISQMENYKGSLEVKEMFMSMLTMFAPTGDSGEAIERLLKVGAEPYAYAKVLGSWAGEDPAAAIAWFREKSAEGELQGTGVRDTSEAILFSELVGGVARKEPAVAVDLFFELAGGGGIANSSTDRLAEGLGRWMAKDGQGDDSELRRLLASGDGGQFRTRVVSSALRGAVEPGDMPASISFIEEYIDDPLARRELKIERITDSGSDTAGQVELAQQHLPSGELPMAVAEIVNSGWYGMREDVEVWLAEQPQSELRDAGYGSLCRHLSLESQYEEALATAEQIGDREQRDEAMGTFARRWYSDDPQAARAALPDHILSEIDESR